MDIKIDDELIRMQDGVKGAWLAVETKQGNVISDKSIENLEPSILAIPTGGMPEPEPEIKPPFPLPTDGKTRLHLRLTSNTGYSPRIYIYKSDASTLSVNWGDGSTLTTNETSGNTSFSHSYPSGSKEYLIDFWISDGNGTFSFGQGTAATGIMGSSQTYRDSILGVYFGKNIINITSNSFSTCRSLSNVTMSDNITSIGTSAFYSCVSLVSAIISNNVTTLPTSIFNSCRVLLNVKIPNNVTSIGDGAFYDSGLINITIPSNVISLGDNTFVACRSLTIYVFEREIPPIITGSTLYDISSIALIFVPNESVELYGSATQWTSYVNRILPKSEMEERLI